MDPVRAGLLLDFYGNLLAKKNRSYLDLYFTEDMTLSEIADLESVSRQAVHESIRRGWNRLNYFEDKLGLVWRFMDHKQSLATALRLLSDQKIDEALTIIHQLYARL